LNNEGQLREKGILKGHWASDMVDFFTTRDYINKILDGEGEHIRLGGIRGFVLPRTVLWDEP
jgi:hypothetical protein